MPRSSGDRACVAGDIIAASIRHDLVRFCARKLISRDDFAESRQWWAPVSQRFSQQPTKDHPRDHSVGDSTPDCHRRPRPQRYLRSNSTTSDGLTVDVAGNQPVVIEQVLSAAGLQADFLASSPKEGVAKPGPAFFTR